MVPIRTPIIPTVRPLAALRRDRQLTPIVIPVPWKIGKTAAARSAPQAAQQRCSSSPSIWRSIGSATFSPTSGGRNLHRPVLPPFRELVLGRVRSTEPAHP